MLPPAEQRLFKERNQRPEFHFNNLKKTRLRYFGYVRVNCSPSFLGMQEISTSHYYVTGKLRALKVRIGFRLTSMRYSMILLKKIQDYLCQKKKKKKKH